MTYASFRLYYGTIAHMYLRILLSIPKEQLPSGVTRYVIPHNKPKTIKPTVTKFGTHDDLEAPWYGADCGFK